VSKKNAAPQKTGHGSGKRAGELFAFPPDGPDGYVIVGLDTKDGPEHHLYDPRIHDPVPDFLVASIRHYGVKKPVLFVRDGERVLVVDGRMRIRAARIARDQQKAAGEVELVVRGLPERGDPARLFGVSRTTNLHIADGPLRNAENAQRMLDMGKGHDEVAMTFGVTEHTLRREWLPLIGASKEVRQAVERGAKNGGVGPTVAAKIAKLPLAEQPKALAELTKDGAKPTVHEAANKLRAAAGKAPVETARGKLTRIANELEKLANQDNDPVVAIDANNKDVLVSALVRIRGIVESK
jgi:ParB family chromosome partitioning protein